MTGTTLDALQTVGACLAAVNAGDFEDLATIVHPDVTVMMVPGFGPARPIVGIHSVGPYFAEARELGISIEVEPYEVKLQSPQAVLVHADYVLRRGDDEQRLCVWIVYRLRAGLIFSIVPYLDREAAVADVR